MEASAADVIVHEDSVDDPYRLTMNITRRAWTELKHIKAETGETHPEIFERLIGEEWGRIRLIRWPHRSRQPVKA